MNTPLARVTRVTMQEIVEQRALGWPDFHPEDYCHRCGIGNISWWIDSDRFNTAMGGLPDGHAWNGIVCIQCFVELHQAATGLTCSWTLTPGTPFRPAYDERATS